MQSHARVHRQAVAGLFALLLSAGCQHDATRPDDDVPAPAATIATQIDCDSICVLANTPKLLSDATVESDSSGALVFLAQVNMRASAGASVHLLLEADEATLAGIPSAERVFVDGPSGTKSIALRDLRTRALAYQFTEAVDVTLRYRLSRNMFRSPDGGLRLIQFVHGPASITQAVRPWLRAHSASAHAALLAATSTGSCVVPPLTASSECNTAVTLNPVVAADHFGATFQSEPGSGASHPITATFSPGVQSVTVTIYDPTWTGNTMTATPGGSVSFSFSGAPGTNIPDTRTISLAGTAVATTEIVRAPGAPTMQTARTPNGTRTTAMTTASGGITQVVLTPAAADYVAYDMSFDPLPADSFDVSCSPSPVTRGESVTCTAASRDPGATVTVSQWMFETPDLSAPIMEGTSAAQWTGVAAVGGTITVEGTINGQSAAGRGTLSVAAREWNGPGDTVAYQVINVQPNGLPVDPTNSAELGEYQPDARAFLPPSGHPQVSAGPNAGVFYFTQVPLNAEADVYVNYVAMQVGSDFYLRQTPNRHGQFCAQSDVPGFVPVVEAHEGLHLEPGSHAYVFRQQLNLLVPPATEALVGLSEDELLSKAAAAISGPTQQAATVATDVQFGGTVQPAQYPCKFRYF